MKIFATGDWHLGNVFHCIDRLDEHRHFFAWLLDRIEEHRPDALLVAGDVFDNANPSAASQRLYYDFLVQATARHKDLKIIVTAGNHDSAARLEAPRDVLACLQVETRGNISKSYVYDGGGSRSAVIDYDDLIIPVDERLVVLAVPYLRNDQVEGDTYSAGVMNFLKALTDRARAKYPCAILVMMAHMYAKGAAIDDKDPSEKIIIGGQEEVDMANWPDHPDYLTCGHIHKRQHIWGVDWARYTGSVLPMSFAEKEYRHGVDLITFNENGKPKVELLEYVPQHPLMVIPDDDEPHSFAELKKMINTRLPMGENPVYVELKVYMDKLSNDKISELKKLAEERNAIICKVMRIVPAVVKPDVDDDTKQIKSVDDILQRSPLKAINDAFKYKNGTQLSTRQTELLTAMLSKIN